MRSLGLGLLTSLILSTACGAPEQGGPPPPGPETGAAGSGGSRPQAGTGGAAGNAGGSGGSAGSGGSSGSGGSPAPAPDAAPAPDSAPAAGDASGSAGTPGLVKIFDGTSWDNWLYDPRCWTIVGGAMHGQCPSGQSQAFTKESYSNFRLILQTRMVTTNDHIGVCLWGDRPGPGKYGFGGCLLVIPPNGAIWDYRTNSDNPKPANDAIKFMFHKVEILADRTTGRVQVAVNGKLVHDYRDKILPQRKHGPIGMQIHKAGAYEVEYKDIEVEVDPKEDRLITLTP